MKQQNQNKYIPPLVLDHVELETENPILAGSGGGGLPFENNVKTTSQSVRDMDFEDGDYNATWRQYWH